MLELIELVFQLMFGPFDLRHFRKIEGQNDRCLRGRQRLANSVLIAVSAQNRLEFELIGDAQSAEQFQLVIRLEDRGLFALHLLDQRGETGICFRTFRRPRILAVGFLRRLIPGSVKKVLPDQRDAAHQRIRVGPIVCTVEIESDVLRHGRRQHHGGDIGFLKIDQRAASAEYAATRHDESAGETKVAQFTCRLSVQV